MQDCGTITEWSMDRTSRAEARSRRHAAAEAAGDGGGSPTCVAAPTCQRLPQPSSSCACRGGRPPACPLPGRGAIREPSAAIPSTVAGAAAAKESSAEREPDSNPGGERRGVRRRTSWRRAVADFTRATDGDAWDDSPEAIPVRTQKP